MIWNRNPFQGSDRATTVSRVSFPAVVDPPLQEISLGKGKCTSSARGVSERQPMRVICNARTVHSGCPFFEFSSHLFASEQGSREWKRRHLHAIRPFRIFGRFWKSLCLERIASF